MDEPPEVMRRWWALQLARFAGLALVIVATLIVAGTIEAPAALGWGLLLAGMVVFFFGPKRLAARWRSG